MPRRLGPLLLLLAVARGPAAVSLPLPPADEPWVVVRSANFTLIGNASASAVAGIASDLERLRAALAQLNPRLTLTSPAPTTIYVFKDETSFVPFQRLYNGRPAAVGGYFLASTYANYVAIGANPRGDGRALVFHEYLHSLLRSNYPTLPLWLNEGLAEYYSTFEAGRGEAKLGLPIEAHLAWLRQHNPMPLRQLLALDSDAPEYNESERRGGFYAQAWALTHYLMSGRGGRQGQLAALLARLQSGTSADAAVGQALGESPEALAALEKELSHYVRLHAIPYSRAVIAPGSEPKSEQAPLARAEVLFRLGDLLANLEASRGGDAETYLRAALALQPAHGPAVAVLARLLEREGRREEAGPLHARAAELSPGDWIAQYRYARFRIEVGDAGALTAARKALLRVVELRPDFGEAWADLGYTYQDDGRLEPEALAALETAHRLLPTRPEVAYNLAIAYANHGRLEEAQRLLDRHLWTDPELSTSVSEAILRQLYNRAEELVAQQRLEEAMARLREIQTKTERPDFRTALGREIEEIGKALAHNGFVDRYNAAVDQVNHGDLRGAVSLLESLVAGTRDPFNARKAQELLDRVRQKLGPKKR